MATKEFFEKIALPFVLKWEGGYVNDPDDKGGATNRGITQYTYNSWLKSLGRATKDVRNLTMSEVSEIYHKNYWLKSGCDKMSDKFALLVFDTAVNMGAGTVKATGRTRAEEFLRAAQWKYPDKFLQARRAKYHEFAKYGNQKKFLQGWLNRVNDLERVMKTV